uniref:Plastid iron-sulfur assembly subunit SufB-like protein 1 n=1 Tax=Euglena longa TaxID=3037 RepID=A0A5J6VX74_EUGLO|nr:plastid iron-sulfur assembly subunit SufB-like protein 1 [Euglena longa]
MSSSATALLRGPTPDSATSRPAPWGAACCIVGAAVLCGMAGAAARSQHLYTAPAVPAVATASLRAGGALAALPAKEGAIQRISRPAVPGAKELQLHVAPSPKPTWCIVAVAMAFPMVIMFLAAAASWGRHKMHIICAVAVASMSGDVIETAMGKESVEVDNGQSDKEDIAKLLSQPYKWGFRSDIPSSTIDKGLNEDVIRLISAKKDEPEWALDFRLKAYRRWLQMEEPQWSDNCHTVIDYQDISYYSEPKVKKKLKSLDEVDPQLLATYEKLGIPLNEQKRLTNVAVDAVFDSVSIATTFRAELLQHGVIFCSISDAIHEHPELVQRYLGKVVPAQDNYFAALNSAVFTDGSFVYIPKGTRCPMDLSTYFRINEKETGQFERTLIVAEDDSYISYLEGCTAPMNDRNQLHAAVVELWAGEGAEIRYSTVQNWFAGNEKGEGGIGYNFVTKRGLCHGSRSKISWTQVETGSAITWKYPSCILKGDRSVGEFHSVAVTNNLQQADTGTKMIHLGKDTRSRIISKGISAGHSRNVYRGLVQVNPSAEGARNHSQCDSMLIGSNAQANTYPYIQVRQDQATVEHEASTSRISEEQLFYMKQRGLSHEMAVGAIVSGFCSEVFNELPMEFAQEVNQLMNLKLTNVG